MILGLLLVVVGLLLSAFFSGSETGFYRIARVRLVMDAKSGKIIARGLLWLVGHPGVVVATVLIGNNIANYCVSLGLLFTSQVLLADWTSGLQTFLPVLATPVLFIYGELLPKYLYYHAPYHLSSRGAPLMVVFAILFLPCSAVVIGLESLWQKLFGSETVRARLSLERQELQKVMMEGQVAGLLLPIQREMAQDLFTYGVRPVRHFTLPLRAIPLVDEGSQTTEILAAARRFQQKYVGVLRAGGDQLIGCYPVADVMILGSREAYVPICQVRAEDSNIVALTKMQDAHCPLASVVDKAGRSLGIVSRDRLVALLLPDS